MTQTDHDELSMQLCKRNGERNGAEGIEYRKADWTAWDEVGRYDWIIGSDILYIENRHPDLLRVFAASLAEAGRVLLADPFRTMSLSLLEKLETEGWGVTCSRWDVGEEGTPRPVGVFELIPPRPGGGAP